MSESREHKRRYNLRLEYIAHFDTWLKSEPPMLLIWRWCKWLKSRPVWDDSKEPFALGGIMPYGGGGSAWQGMHMRGG